MNEKLQSKIDLMTSNYLVVENSGKLEFSQAASLGALIFTAANVQAGEERIRACRKILKERAGLFSNFRGATNLATLCRMALQDNPAAWLDDVMKAYEYVGAGTKKFFRGESLIFAAMTIAAKAEPSEYERIAKESWDLLHIMSASHPLITTHSDLTVASMMVMAGLDAEAMLAEAEVIYGRLKPTGFKLNKNALQSVSMILALSEKPLEQKCERFIALRQALKDSGHKLTSDELAVLAAFC